MEDEIERRVLWEHLVALHPTGGAHTGLGWSLAYMERVHERLHYWSTGEWGEEHEREHEEHGWKLLN